MFVTESTCQAQPIVTAAGVQAGDYQGNSLVS